MDRRYEDEKVRKSGIRRQKLEIWKQMSEVRNQRREGSRVGKSEGQTQRFEHRTLNL